VPGSAHMYRERDGYKGDLGIKLSNKIVTPFGAPVGLEKPDGNIPGGGDNGINVVIKLNVIRDNQ